MYLKKTTYLITLLILLSCKEEKLPKKRGIQPNEYKWTTKPNKETTAGDTIRFGIKTELPYKNFSLLLSNDYNHTIIEGRKNSNNVTFSIPKTFTKIAGYLNYTLLYNNDLIENNKIYINSNPTTNLVETYCGPAFIVASKSDYAMMVNIPMDHYDNPNMIGMTIVETYLNEKSYTRSNTRELLAHKKVYSEIKSGKKFIQCFTDDGIKSKLREAAILANNAVDFEIFYDRHNNLADYNEITTLYTSIIRDQYDNVIENGTIVSFYLTHNNIHRKAFGKTNNGIAHGLFIHPKEKIEFSVKAYVENFAESNVLKINYNPLTIDHEKIHTDR